MAQSAGFSPVNADHTDNKYNQTVDSILNVGQTEAKSQDAAALRDAEALDVLHQFSPKEQERIIKTLRYIRKIQP